MNPECEHVEGDMRNVVHNAVVYMTTESDLKKAIETAFVHCRPGGAALFAPDQSARPSGRRPITAVTTHSELDPGTYEVLVASKPGREGTEG